MSKSGATVLLLFQCPGICPTQSQLDMIVSDDSPVLARTIYTYNIIFTWVESHIRIKSEVGTVKQVEVFQHFFY